MSVDVTMPKLSDTMEEGKILRWLKHVGDAVRPGDVLAEVETDKANMELEAYDEGVLAELRIGEGDSAPVGAVIAVLDAPGAAKAAPSGEKPSRPAEKPRAAERPEAAERRPGDGRRAPEARAPAEPAPKPSPRPAAPREPESWRPTVVRRGEEGGDAAPKASPLARRIAREHGLDLAGIPGTGPGGRVVEKDVEAAVARQAGGERSRKVPAPEPAPAEAPRAPAAGRVELSRVRRTTAKRMGEAKREVPHFYASAEIAMDEVMRLKEGLTGVGEDYEGLTYTHLVLKAVGLALRRVPELNASYDGDAMVLHDTVHVGLATATDDGLMVPVVRDCDRASVATIAREARALVERARAGRFAADDLSGGTFTVSNLGMFPVSEFAAIINPPQAAILAVSAIRAVPVVRDGQVVPGHVMKVTLSCDHRIVDGVLAGRFLRELKTLLEQPLALVV